MESKIRSGGGNEWALPEDITHYRLFMLNLHRFLDGSLELEKTIRDLRRKYRGDYVYGKSFVAESSLHITETLDTVIFFLNALTGGSDMDLFDDLDKLKSLISKCFDENRFSGSAAVAGENSAESEDEVSALLRRIMEYTIGEGLPDGDVTAGKPDNEATARNLLVRCYDRVFSILDAWLQSIMTAVGREKAQTVPIIGIPTGYLLRDDTVLFETDFRSGETCDDPRSNPGVSRLLEGMSEFWGSGLYTQFVEKPRDDDDTCGFIIYSNETMAFYHFTGKFKNLVVADICDAVGSNHIYLLTKTAGQSDLPPSSHLLVGKLLERLDFQTFTGFGFTIASIRNMTRANMENHLNTLGKLLTFVSSTGIPPANDQSVRRNIEVFLEHIV